MIDKWVPLMFLTFAGSSLGGLARYLLSEWIASRLGERFPFGTMVVNVSGAFLIGVVWGLPWDDRAPLAGFASDFLLYGFLGGYTTVSSFTLNTLNLFQDGEWRSALLNLFGSYFLCLAAVFVGVSVIRIV